MALNSSSSSLKNLYHCITSSAASIVSITYIITHIFLLLPLSLIIFYLGYQQWRRQRSFSTTSHSDIFTYHAVAMELIFTVGGVLYCCGLYTAFSDLMTAGCFAASIFFSGQISLHILTCIERYVAVVHPVNYMGLRQSGGVKLRNISIVCVWLQYCGWTSVEALYYPNIPYVPAFCWLAFSLTVVSYCSLSVLYVLIRPSPGEIGGNRDWIDKSKQRAFLTITAITGAQWFFFLGVLVSVALESSQMLSYEDGCILLMLGYWFSLPSSSVLPLLFLHRAGKLVFWHCSNE